jgi:putative transcriptional regulator
MAIIVQLDTALAKRKMSLAELAKKIDYQVADLCLLTSGNAKGVRMITMNLICDALDCQPGDLFEFVRKKEPIKRSQDQD